MTKTKSTPTTIDKLNGVDLLALPPGQYQDGKGLSLQVSATQRSWVFRYKDPETQSYRNKGFGSLDRVTPQAARLKRDNALLKLESGEHPFPRNDGDRTVPTFLTIAKQVIATQTETVRSQKTKDKWDRDLLVRAKSLHDRPINEITTGDITELLKPIWLVKKPTASEFRKRMEKVFSAAIADEIIDRNPAALRDNIEHKLKKQQHRTKHQPAMPHAEVPAFMGELGDYDALSSMALMFTILSCARTDEVLTAQWDHIDLDNAKLWEVRGGDEMKNHLMARIPLTTAMVTLLRRIKAMNYGGEFVFPGLENGHLSNATMLKLLQRALKRPQYTVHGFRASFRSWGQTTKLDKDVLEYCLHHIEGSRTEQAYMREECLDQRREALEQWSAYCLPYVEKLRLVA